MYKRRKTPTHVMSDEPKLINLKVRISGETRDLAVPGSATLSELRSSCEDLLGGRLLNLSFQGSTRVTLISDGTLAVGSDASLASLGLENRTLLAASFQTVASLSSPAPSPKRKATPEETHIATTWGADSAAYLDDESKNRAAGSIRLDAASKGPGFVEITDSGKSLKVTYKLTQKGKEHSENVKRISPSDCIELSASILVRSSGSKTRRVGLLKKNGGKGPSTEVLREEEISFRSPSLFWSLYDHSR